MFKKSKRLSSIACLAMMSTISASTASRAGTITGTFQGVSDIEVQQIVLTQPVGSPVTYSDVRATIGFSFSYDDPYPHLNSFQFAGSVLSFTAVDVGYAYFSVTDGIPGQSADQAIFIFDAGVYHAYTLNATLRLFDPSGEFIGPNGDGDPSNVQITVGFQYDQENNSDTGYNYTVNFTNVLEPSSIVLATIAALLVSSVGLRGIRR